MKEQEAIDELLELIGCTSLCTPEEIVDKYAKAVSEAGAAATLNSAEF